MHERGHIGAKSGSRIRWWSAKSMPAIVLLALSFGGATPNPPSVPPGTWVITRANAEVLEALDPELTASFLDSPAAIALDGYGGARPAKGWASLAAFEADVAAGLVPDDVQLVMYDPEAWSHTPLLEQLDPVKAMAEFAALAHGRGYEVLMTPHPGLVTVPGAECPRQPGESITGAFLRCGFPAAAAEHGDVVDLQLQALQRDPQRYGDAIAAAARQARRADPDVEVLAHLTTRTAPDPTVLYTAWRAAQPFVDGQYLGMPGGHRAGVAIGFLRMVAIGLPQPRR